MLDRQPSNRLPKRSGSGRFPIRVRTNTGADADPASTTTPNATLSASSSSASTPASSSAKSLVSSQRLPAPPIPSRSQHRLDSQSHGTLNGILNDRPRRPGVVPLIVGSERLRSNSEGFVPAIRTKRMGIITRKTSELGTVDEVRTSRFSHYRGLSHGSVMAGKHADGARERNGGASSPVSPAEAERTRHQYVHRLSSVPERRPPSPVTVDKTVDGIMSMLHSFSLIHAHMATFIGVFRDTTTTTTTNTTHASHRSSLERVFDNASTHVEKLDRELTRIITLGGRTEPIAERDAEAARQACLDCVMAYQHLAALLLRQVEQVVQQVDKRYVRSLLLFIYNGRVELRNAGLSLFRLDRTEHGAAPPSASVHDVLITPTQSQVEPVAASVLRSDMLSSRWVGGYAMASHGTYAPPVRSNASSRAGSLSSAVSAAASAPLSADSFGAPASTADALPRPEMVPAAFEDDAATTVREERQFERLYQKLYQADEIVLRALPTIKQQFVRCLEVCDKEETEAELRSIWTSLESKSSLCIKMAEQLKARLSTIAVKEPEARNDRDFWQVCGLFVKAFVDTACPIKDACSLRLISNDILQLIRPVSKAVKEAGMLIETSPWKYLADVQPRVPLGMHAGPGPINVAQAQAQAHTHAAAGAGVGSTYTNGGGAISSPYIAPLPATPLSAALGPAAQATVPTTSASVSVSASTTMTASSFASSSTSTFTSSGGSGGGGGLRNGMFSGNVFERADSLLSAPSRSGTMTGSGGGGGVGTYSSHGSHNPTMVSPLSSRINHTRLHS